MPEERRERPLVYMSKDLFLMEALDDIDITISPSEREILRPLAAEVAELVEIFQWMTPEEAVAVKNTPNLKSAVEDEIADVMNYILRITDVLDIDLERTVLNKIDKNAIKYPPAGSKTPRSKRGM